MTLPPVPAQKESNERKTAIGRVCSAAEYVAEEDEADGIDSGVIRAAIRVVRALGSETGPLADHRERIKWAWGNVEQAYIDGAPNKTWIRHATVLWKAIDDAIAALPPRSSSSEEPE